MAELELIKFIAMIFSLIAIINIPIIFKKRKDFIKYIPGFICLILVLTFNSLDDLELIEYFNFLEIGFLLSGAILFLLAMFIEIRQLIISKNDDNSQNIKQIGKDGEY